MKIKNISCTQFAGIRDRSISFSDGINVICGRNESGKSTVVNLISRTLFQNAHIDRRSDKDFRELYFPAPVKGSTLSGDFADGKITFETESGTFTLSKEWGAEPLCRLSAPDGVIRDQSKIDSILRDVLTYGEGVYSEMLFSSQRSSDSSLQTVMDASKKTDAKQELADAVSMAFAESDGISVDSIEQAINDKIDEIAGKHWDTEREMPMRKSGRWSTGLGEILKAYYELEDANNVLEEISHLEADSSRSANDFGEKDLAAAKAEEEYNRFNMFAGQLAVQNERRKTVERTEKELAKIKTVLAAWPALCETVDKAKHLQDEKTDREIFDKYTAAKQIADEIALIEASVAQRSCPSDAEIAAVNMAERKRNTLENKLCGMNINAAIKMLGTNTVEITSLRTGEPIELCGENAAVTEAVRIVIPGVAEMCLSPADVDVSSVEAQIAEQTKTISDIFEKYGVGSLRELESAAKSVAEAKMKADAASSRFAMLLGDTSFEALQASAETVTAELRSKADIESDIHAVCGGIDTGRFIAAKETVLQSYLAEYGSINELKAKAFDLAEELNKARESVNLAEDVPAEYASVADPDAYLENLRNTMKLSQSLRELALTAKTAAASKLESYRSAVSDTPYEDAEKAARKFEEQKSRLSHLMHIKEVFEEQKAGIQNNPMADIADRFTHYLGVITDGRVSSEFPDADKLNMNVYSENRLLDFGKLSEGTKETVSLAFRLAVLDHLFPSGGGVIVFDDPFTDMDTVRAERSCKLIKECAERHQVIFLSCREEYAKLLGGNLISF